MTTQRPRLLVVDDSGEIAFLVQRLAKGASYEVVVRSDAASAWDFLGQNKPDLLLVDINLPGENGAVLCRRVRGAKELDSVPVAVFSHWQRTEDIIAGLSAGAEFVVSKELLCRPDEWQARIEELLTPVNSRKSRLSLSLNRVRGLNLCIKDEEAIQRALWAGPLKLLDHELLSVLLERAAAKAGSTHPGRRLLELAMALAEQLWCVAGSAAANAFADAVATALTGTAEPEQP